MFRNDITDFIDQVAFGTPPCSAGPPPAPSLPFCQFLQYQNIAHARIEGFEAETLYDADSGMSASPAHLIQGKNLATNFGLSTITPRKITTTGGVRLLDRRLILAAQWTSVGSNNNIPSDLSALDRV